MHEYFIVQNILKITEELMKKYPGKKIVKVVLLIGRYSGVEPDLLKSALEFFKKESPLEEAEILIEIEDFKIRCKDCKKDFSKEKWDLSCPFCDSFNTEVISGEKILLKTLELMDAN
ncbi:MAG: hydrogenase maturation nickel metallochaperone HypA [Thermodesulfobacteriaceae bacterium]|nr:hydrogenase maturation nickel metallochaperone HypA [Thermodesulfobacteriaceae bacterium]MCX8041874.1 hydrogenase maturation nickel metallochaperone HypA [Thermodesulfobacteriaceae bacterium]